jgi:hypothetical protein
MNMLTSNAARCSHMGVCVCVSLVLVSDGVHADGTIMDQHQRHTPPATPAR